MNVETLLITDRDPRAPITSMSIQETVVMDAAKMKMTRDGYLVAEPRIARTGIQVYAGRELGVKDEYVSVYRPPEEVFARDAMESFAHRPVTDDHPPEMVSAANWKKYSVGQLDGVMVKDGEYLRVPMMLMDAAVIQRVKDGKVQLSAGYTAELVWGDGVTPEGERYQAVQRNIRANHVAVVKAARGGTKLKIGDGSNDTAVTDDNTQLAKETKPMTTRTILVDGISCTVPDMEAAVIERSMKALNDTVSALNTKVSAAENTIATLTTDNAKLKDAMSEEEKKKKEEMEAKDAEITTLKKQLEDAAVTPAKLEDMVAARAETVAKAKAVLGDKLDATGKSLADVMKQVVSTKIGDAAKDWSDSQIAASFETLTSGVKIGDAATKIAASIKDGSHNVTDTKAKVAAGYSSYNDKLTNAWRKPGATA